MPGKHKQQPKGKWSGQTRAEFNKNYTRIRNIINECGGDQEKESTKALTQANRITDEYKAINRAMAAKEMGHEHLFEVFFTRAYKIGAVSLQDYRDYRLTQLGI